MVRVEIPEPAIDQAERGFRIRQRCRAHVFAVEFVQQCFGRAITLRALHPAEAKAQTKLPGKNACILRRVRRAIVAEHLDKMWRLASTAAPLYRLEHHVAMCNPLMPAFTTIHQAMT